MKRSKRGTALVLVVAATSDAAPQTRQLLDVFKSLDEARKSEFCSALSPSEKMVLKQIVTPNHEAWLHLIADQGWDEAADNVRAGPVHLKFEYAHLARGLEMGLQFFEQVAADIRRKFIAYLETGEAFEHLDQSVLRRLEAVFGLPPAPLCLDVTTVRRLLTITARDQIGKVTAEVAGMLEAVGAKVPSRVPDVKTSTPISPQVEQPFDDPPEDDHDRLGALAVYTLVVSALAVAEKDEVPGAAERRNRLKLVAAAYFPFTGLERPSWTPDAIEVSAVVADEVHLD